MHLPLSNGKILLPLASPQHWFSSRPPSCRLSPHLLLLAPPAALSSAFSHQCPLQPLPLPQALPVSPCLPGPPGPSLFPLLPFPPIPGWGWWLEFGGGSPSGLYHPHKLLEGQKPVFLLKTTPSLPSPCWAQGQMLAWLAVAMGTSQGHPCAWSSLSSSGLVLGHRCS